MNNFSPAIDNGSVTYSGDVSLGTTYYPMGGTADYGTSITIGTTGNWCSSCGSYWYGWLSHHCYHATAHEHDFEQARGEYEGTLFCRKCGETQKLRLPKVKP